jgi:ADP-heptose:LPS heptosyltransferase
MGAALFVGPHPGRSADRRIAVARASLDRYNPATLPDPRSILIIKPSSLGDVVHTLPAVACVKRRWPAARLSWLVNPEWAPLLRDNPYLHDVIEFPRKRFGGLWGWTRFPAWVRALKERVQPDLVLDFQGLLRSALIARGCGGDIWGTSDSREGARFFHQHIVKVPPRSEPVHAVQRALALAAALGCDTTACLEWPLPAGTAPAPALPPRFVLLHPFARGSGKSLRAGEVANFCRALAPLPVVIVGVEGKAPAMENVVDLLGQTTLPQLCWVIRRAEFVVSVDSGPAHIAAAITERMLAIHTWSDPRQVGPCRPGAWVWKDDRIGRVSEFPEGTPCERGALGAWVKERLG